MIPVDQTVFTVPGGNCFSACVASLLELPLSEVPYFMGDAPIEEPYDWFQGFLEWLRPLGWWAMCLNLDNEWRPDGLCILSGKSPRGDFSHSVVARGRGGTHFEIKGHPLVVEHDPHPSREGIETQDDVVVLVPIDPRCVR